jgi:hypothetical protein
MTIKTKDKALLTMMVSRDKPTTTVNTAGCFGRSLSAITQVTAIQQPHLLYPYVLASGSGVPIQAGINTAATPQPISNRVMRIIVRVCQTFLNRKDGVLCNPIS